MKKSIATGLLVFVFLVPQLSFAQTNGEGDVVSSCISLISLLTLGSSDTGSQRQVSSLQDFLIERGLLTTSSGGPTGYYGIRTVASVKTYQKAKGIIQTGSVGPLTRAAIAADTGCGTDSATSNASAVTMAATTSPTTGISSAPLALTYATKFYFIYVGGNTSSTGFSTKEEALSRCMATKANNPNTSIWCSWNQREIYSYYPPAQSTTNAASTASTQFVVGPGNSTQTTTINSSGLSVGVSNSPTGPFVASATNSGKIYTRTTGLTKANNPKGCASPKGATGCLTVSSTTYRDFTSTEWGTSTTSVITVTNGGTFPNGEYDGYISYPNQAAIKVGTFGIWAVDPATYTGPVFGAGPEGIPGNANVTYSWYVWTGPYTLWQGVWNLNYPQPTVACTASNVGATYYLGKGYDDRDIVATCYASNQQMTAAFTPVTSTTLNHPGSSTQVPTASLSLSATTVQVDADFTANFAMTNSPTSGDLRLDDRVLHFDSALSTSWTGSPAYLGFAAGSHTLSFRACNASGCSGYSAPVSITVTNTPPAASCTWTTGSFPAENPTTNWACGSAQCTGAPAGTGWVNQNNGCYHQPIPTN